MQGTTIWNSFLAWAMSTGTGNPPGSFFTLMLEFPGLQEGLAAQPAANTNLQIHWSLLNWLQVSAQVPQKEFYSFKDEISQAGSFSMGRKSIKFLRSLRYFCKRVHRTQVLPNCCHPTGHDSSSSKTVPHGCGREAGSQIVSELALP